jgi:hypothetical protein
MQLEEMKTLWTEISAEVDKQKKITDALVVKMTKTDYRHQISKILIPEIIGALVCFAGAVFILAGFHQMNTWYLMASAVAAVLILFLLPVLSVKAVLAIRSVHISGNNYKQSLSEYSKGKLQWVFIQKWSFYLGAILLLTILPVMGKLIGGKDLFTETSLWLWYVIGYPFFYALSRWVFKRYMQTAGEAEKILKELEQE